MVDRSAFAEAFDFAYTIADGMADRGSLTVSRLAVISGRAIREKCFGLRIGSLSLQGGAPLSSGGRRDGVVRAGAADDDSLAGGPPPREGGNPRTCPDLPGPAQTYPDLPRPGSGRNHGRNSGISPSERLQG